MGSGVKRILEKYDESIFDISPNFMKVTFRFRHEDVGINVGINVATNIKLNKTQEGILMEISRDKQITQKEIALNLNVSTRTVQRNTSLLTGKGLLKRIGSNKNGYWEISTGGENAEI